MHNTAKCEFLDLQFVKHVGAQYSDVLTHKLVITGIPIKKVIRSVKKQIITSAMVT